jgi:hypothetical protein
MRARPAFLAWSAAALVYAVLSLLAFFAPSLDWLRIAIQTRWTLLWMFGPPATLIYGMAGLAVYIFETVALIGLCAVAGSRRTPFAAAVFGVCAFVFWLMTGFLAMTVLT